MSTSELLDQMSNSERDERREAVYELVRRGETSSEVIGAYASGIEDDDTQVRFQSLVGLARAGRQAEPAIPELLECLKHRDDQVRFRAADALGKIGPAAIEPLLTAWEDSSSNSRVEIARSLAIMGPDAAQDRIGDFLREALSDDSPEVRRYVAEAIVAIEPMDSESLLVLADHADGDVRKVGILALGNLPAPSELVKKRLQSAAGDEDAKVREIAVIALGKSKLPAEQKADLIEQALLDETVSVRAAAIAAIGKASLNRPSFARRLGQHLDQVTPEVGDSLVRALGELAPESKVVLPELLEAYATSSMDTKILARTIASFGPGVVDDLLNQLNGAPELETLVADALARIGKPAVQHLLDGMSSTDEAVRMASIRALGGIRPTQESWLREILARTGDAAAGVRTVAIRSLAAAGDQAEFAREKILRLTSDSDAQVRAAAFSGLAAFDFAADALAEAITRGLHDESADVRGSCLRTIAQIDGATNQQLVAVVDLLSGPAAVDPSAQVRAEAVKTLRSLDPESDVVREQKTLLASAIESGLRDEDKQVRIQSTLTAQKLALSTPEILAALADNLTEDTELLQATLLALRQFGSEAKKLGSALSQLIDHRSESVRVAAVQTYAAVQPDRQALTGRLTEALDDTAWAVRQAAAESLGELGPDAKSSIPRLFEMLSSDEDSDFARGAIREIDAAPEEAIPQLIAGMDSDDRRTSYYAIFLLGKIGPPAAGALPKLEKRLAESGDESDYRRRYLEQAIASIKGEEVDEDR